MSNITGNNNDHRHHRHHRHHSLVTREPRQFLTLTTLVDFDTMTAVTNLLGRRWRIPDPLRVRTLRAQQIQIGRGVTVVGQIGSVEVSRSDRNHQPVTYLAVLTGSRVDPGEEFLFEPAQHGFHDQILETQWFRRVVTTRLGGRR